MKAKKYRKPSRPTKKSRKELRKEIRKQKKARRNEYYTKRQKNGKFVLNSNQSESQNTLSANKKQNTTEISENRKGESKKVLKTQKKSSEKSTVIQDNLQRTLLKEKREHEKLRKEMAQQRKELLHKANEEEDRNIRRLEKQLHLNKRKSKNAPKSFTEDGLDYLLEMCDSDNMKAAVAAEQQFSEVNDDFAEDFALMTGKKLKNNESSDQEDEIGDEFDVDMEDSLDNNEEQSDDLEEESDNNDDDKMDISDASDVESETDDAPESTSKKLKDLGDSKNKSMKNKNIYNEDDGDDQDAVDDDISHSESEGADDETMENSNSDSDEKTEQKNEIWEDIYGRLRKKDGTVIQENEGKYIPPAIRAKMETASGDKHRQEKLNRLRKQMKGLLNRLAESNMHNIASQFENLYMNNSRNDMNDSLTSLMLESIVTPILTPERLLLEHVMLVTILHANVGTEVGAHFLQTVIKKFDELYNAEHPVENKMLDNVVWVIAQLYNFKVFHVQLIYEILNKLSKRFTEKDIECLLLILKSVGFSLRKDDPLELKNLILKLQKQANSANADMRENPRVKFMLDILLAIKNNNMSKIPNYDTSYSEHLKKLLKGLIRKGYYVTTLNISLEDLLKAEEYGKWWVVGSAWSGKTTEVDTNKSSANKVEGFSQKLLDLARKQRMNTDTRRSIFCILMSSEDYLDAFEKLLHLGLKNQQEREIVHVILHCCLQEKVFNPYYAVLAQKFCEHDRKFQMTIKYSVWDKLKALMECSPNQLSNLAKLLTHLFLEKGLPISVLKIVQFSELDKITLRFMRQILIGILLCEDEDVCQAVFNNIAQSGKLKMFRESLKLFIQHFLLRNLKSETIPNEQKKLFEERAKMVDRILSVSDKKIRF